jgi:hypothetical protein
MRPEVSETAFTRVRGWTLVLAGYSTRMPSPRKQAFYPTCFETRIVGRVGEKETVCLGTLVR